MNDQNAKPTLAIICDLSGIVQEVIRDDFHLQDRIRPRHLFTLALDAGSLHKALNFLTQLQTYDTAFDWQLNVHLVDEMVTLYFAGARMEDSFLIIAATNGLEARQAMDELMLINNEQTNALRQALKEKAEQKLEQSMDSTLYNKLSRLNNELITLHRELAQKNQELARLNEVKNQFLGMTAHDLRHPIGIIQMYSEFLLDESAHELSEEHVQFLQVIQTSSSSMHALLNDFLDISKIESGHLEMHFQSQDPAPLIQANITFNRMAATKKDISIDLLEENLPHIRMDGPKIDQVLNNLLSNAVKFSPAGARIQVRVEPCGSGIAVHVQDQGTGIPAQTMDCLFDPFTRVRTRSGDHNQGSGLGLAIVKKIVHDHGGQVTVHSQEGEGSTFSVYLPG